MKHYNKSGLMVCVAVAILAGFDGLYAKEAEPETPGAEAAAAALAAIKATDAAGNHSGGTQSGNSAATADLDRAIEKKPGVLSGISAVARTSETIELVAPEDGAVYDTHSPCVKEFYANFDKRGVKPSRPPLTEEEKKMRDESIAKRGSWYDRFDFYIFNDYTREWNKRCCAENKTWKEFKWKADYSLDKFTVEFSETADFAKPIIEAAGRKWDRAIRPKYLKLGTRYFWRVKAKDKNGAEKVSGVRSFTTAEVPPRMIGLPELNFRDMGGGTNVFGAKVRQGLLYRGRAPHFTTTPEQVKDFFVDKLGIKLDLDVRGREECLKARAGGEGNLEEAGIKYVGMAMEDYHLYHPRSLDCFPKIMALLADRSNYPVYIHCAVGSDRTGTICAVLDGVLGRSDRYAYDDYESPSFCEWLPRFRYGRKSSELFGYLDPNAPRWEECHGKLTGKDIRENSEQFLLAIGVPQAHIDAFRDIMLEQ